MFDVLRIFIITDVSEYLFKAKEIDTNLRIMYKAFLQKTEQEEKM